MGELRVTAPDFEVTGCMVAQVEGEAESVECSLMAHEALEEGQMKINS